MRATLVKWDAAELERAMPAWKRTARRVARRFGVDVFSPQPDPQMSNPAEHPACLEVIELAEGRDPQTVYRRT